MGCSPSALRHVANPIEAKQAKAANLSAPGKTEKDDLGAAPTRLVVNATSQSEISSTPILSSDGPSVPRRRPTVDEYKGAVPPHNEVERMEAFNAIGLANAPQNPSTARIAHVLAKLLEVACCNIHFIDEGIFRMNTSQTVACFTEDFSPVDMPRKLSLCTWTLVPEFPEVLVVPDALQDIRFRDHPIIKGEPHFRFYVGCPLVTFQGFRVGSLCCLDGQPHTLTVQDINMLCNFAELVVREIEKKHVVEEMERGVLGSVPDKTGSSDYYSEGIIITDVADPYACPLLWLNTICKEMLGLDDDQAYQSSLGDVFAVADDTEEGKESKVQEWVSCVKSSEEFVLKAAAVKTGTTKFADLHFRPVTSDAVDEQMPLIGIPSFIKPAGATAKPCAHYFVSVRPTAMPAGSQAQPEAAKSAEEEGHAAEAPVHLRTTLTRKAPSSSGSLEGVELGQFIGRTQMGRVFRGTFNGEPVTVKVVEQQVRGEEPADAELAEARLTKQLAHPNIAITHKTLSRKRMAGRSQLRRYNAKKLLVSEGEAAEPKPKSQTLEFWLVREYCDKGSLSEAMERGWFMTEDSVLNSAPASDMVAVCATAKDIASAMAYVHSKGIIHGDLRGDSLGLASSDQDPRGFTAKVMDFDVAVKAGDEAVPCNSTIASFTHMGPEMILDKTITKAVDVYAFGVMMWQLVSGEEPWLGLTNDVITAQVVQQKMQLQFSAFEPAEYKALALECMAYDPKQRPTFQNVEQRLSQLQSTVSPSSEKAYVRAPTVKKA